MKTWTKPSFREIQMNAEIGSYQPDDGGVDRVTSGEREARSVPSPRSVDETASVVVTVSPA
jgi:hypothetical protein